MRRVKAKIVMASGAQHSVEFETDHENVYDVLPYFLRQESIAVKGDTFILCKHIESVEIDLEKKKEPVPKEEPKKVEPPKAKEAEEKQQEEFPITQTKPETVSLEEQTASTEKQVKKKKKKSRWGL